jgi:hypothetical protein
VQSRSSMRFSRWGVNSSSQSHHSGHCMRNPSGSRSIASSVDLRPAFTLTNLPILLVRQCDHKPPDTTSLRLTVGEPRSLPTCYTLYSKRSTISKPCCPMLQAPKHGRRPLLTTAPPRRCVGKARDAHVRVSAASACGSQNVISIARYSSTAVESSARACSRRPSLPYRVPRPKWQCAWSGRIPRASARARA